MQMGIYGLLGKHEVKAAECWPSSYNYMFMD